MATKGAERSQCGMGLAGAQRGARPQVCGTLLWGAPWPPPPRGALVRGALVGRCRPLSHLGVGFSRFSFSRGVKGFLSVLCRVSLERPGTQAGAAGDPSWAASSPGPPAAARPPEPPGSACGRRVRFSSRVLRDTQDGPSRSQAASAGRRCPNASVSLDQFSLPVPMGNAPFNDFLGWF